MKKDLYYSLKKDASEVRNCITTYIKYIIGITSFTGLSSFIVNSNFSPENKLYLILFIMICLIFLFEVIWYKFKSHNRYIGYIQLLSQEHRYIEISGLTEKELKNKSYITDYKKFVKKIDDQKEGESKIAPSDYDSWEHMMSRLNDHHFQNINEDDELKKSRALKSTSDSKFVFVVSDKLYPHIKINDYDRKFFDKIIWTLYGKKRTSKRALVDNFNLLFNPNFKYSSEFFGIDRKYVSYGWKYPRKITQIATISIFLLAVSFFVFMSWQWEIADSISEVDWKITRYPLFLASINIGILIWWYLRYIRNLKDIVYGKDSIDGYCWSFFPYRVKYLNNVFGYIPIYFSRNFIRFFKSNIYLRNFKNSSDVRKTIDSEIKQNYEEVYSVVSEKLKQNETIDTFFTDKLIESYHKKLKGYGEFNLEEKLVHSIVKNSFKIS